MNRYITAKKFTKIFLIFLFLFTSFHLIIWNFYTSKIFGRDDDLYVGDLGRLSYQVKSLYPRKLEYNTLKKHLNHDYEKNINIDVLTIGDSFSNADTGGTNPYYQDYLSTIYDKNVLNIKKITNNDYSYFDLVIGLYNNGWLKNHNTKVIILETAVKSIHKRFDKELEFKTDSFDTDSIVTKIKKNNSFIPQLQTINTANYKFFYYNIMYNFKSKATKSVVKMKLTKNLFSVSDYENQLLFHYDDISFIDNNKNKIERMNENLNKLARFLKQQDIKLIVMPVVDKYDLYSSFILSNKYKNNLFFEIIKDLNKEYYFVNTKDILLPLLLNGEKDIYYADDTHWSYKASEIIMKDKVFIDVFNSN